MSNRLPKAYGFDPIRDIQVLCPTKIGFTGSVELNACLQEILNPPAPRQNPSWAIPVIRRSCAWEIRLMQVKNDYDITYERAGAEAGVGAYNGDLGIITAVDRDARSVTVMMDDRKYVYSADQLAELEPAYAITIHKSQGSEFPAVVLPVAEVPARLRYRNLLYTGVTRARETLCAYRQRSYRTTNGRQRAAESAVQLSALSADRSIYPDGAGHHEKTGRKTLG